MFVTIDSSAADVSVVKVNQPLGPGLLPGPDPAAGYVLLEGEITPMALACCRTS